MHTQRTFGLHDVPEHRHNLKKQAANLGMEVCKTDEQRADYIRTLVQGIFQSDLPGIQVINETQIVSGGSSMTAIPEFERVLNTWRDFPRHALARIIQEEQLRLKGSHLKLVTDHADAEGIVEPEAEQAA